MASLSELEQRKDQQYLDGYNLGYEIQKLSENKELSEKDKALLETATKALSKSKSESDKMHGIRDGRKQYLREKEKEKTIEKRKASSKERER